MSKETDDKASDQKLRELGRSLRAEIDLQISNLSAGEKAAAIERALNRSAAEPEAPVGLPPVGLLGWILRTGSYGALAATATAVILFAAIYPFEKPGNIEPLGFSAETESPTDVDSEIVRELAQAVVEGDLYEEQAENELLGDDLLAAGEFGRELNNIMSSEVLIFDYQPLLAIHEDQPFGYPTGAGEEESGFYEYINGDEYET